MFLGKPEWIPEEKCDLWTAITLVFWCLWWDHHNIVVKAERPLA
jgi:hypothetical protein